MTNVKKLSFENNQIGHKREKIETPLVYFTKIHHNTCSSIYLFRHVSSEERVGGGAAPQPPLFLMANIFLKFTYKELDYYGVAPPPPLSESM